MAKVTEDLVLKVRAKLIVDKATAVACLKMVELYVNSNPVNLMANKSENGEVQFYYEPIDTSDGRCGNA